MTNEGVVDRSEPSSIRIPSRGRHSVQAWCIGLGRKAASIRDGCQREPVRFLAYALIATSFVFMAMPWVDLAVSGWFASAEGDFLHARDPILLAIRDINRKVPHLVLTAMAAILLAHAFGARSGWLVRPHQAIFVFGVYAIGSGLVVSLLKEMVGRARPEDTVPFGGTAPYTLPWQFADACARNCSFSSGEAGSAAAMLSCVMLAPASIRRPLFWSMVPVAIVFSLLRVAFGKHFLSDVVVSWLLVALVAVVLWRWLERHAETIDRATVGSGGPLAAGTRRRLQTATGMVSKWRADRSASRANPGSSRKTVFSRLAG
ncbi:phosphatase PAP2 family protein [Aquibium sp. ELW1220]|uniref:phosphatase PAP2 family protein n=1 Tax=Aquibium sp. ELW1220 TaxID=2976766 RepID=UPI0025B09BD5|nr:phosphatase PAP2 family protein [Aquibium sp. ELW1220]MDN2579981.1 phosphatase PAP2 family protein [Aquibium sp. ELW1220]